MAFKTYRALIGTKVSSGGKTIVFKELLYKTDKVDEQKMLEDDKNVTCVDAKAKKAEPKRVEVEEALETTEEKSSKKKKKK